MDIPSVKANVDSQSLEEDKKPVDNPEQTEGTDEV
jgi:hypothetical protein